MMAAYVKLLGSGGAWRSLVAHHNGVVGVGGSNPLAPTSLRNDSFGRLKPEPDC